MYVRWDQERLLIGDCVDQEAIAKELGFAGVTMNSMDAVSDVILRVSIYRSSDSWDASIAIE